MTSTAQTAKDFAQVGEVKLWDWLRDYANGVDDTHDAVMLREIATNYQWCVSTIERLEAEAKDRG